MRQPHDRPLGGDRVALTFDIVSSTNSPDGAFRTVAATQLSDG